MQYAKVAALNYIVFALCHKHKVPVVHTQAPYSNHGAINTENEEGGIYAGGSTDGLVQSNSGQRLMLNLTEQEQGYSGAFNVGVDLP